MNEDIAVSIVILPPEEITRMAIDINKSVIRTDGSDIKLDGTFVLPHITLFMGCIKRSSIEKIYDVIRELAGIYNKFELETVPSEIEKHWINIGVSETIRDIHNAILNRVSSLMHYLVTEDMLKLDKNETLDSRTIDYINKFLINYAGYNYRPHITVQSGRIPIEYPQTVFTADNITLCRLGDLCTCREVLFSCNLN